MVASGLNNLGVMHRENGNYETAAVFVRESLEMRKRLHGDDHATVGMGLANLSRLNLFRQRFAEASELAVAGLDICTAQLPENHPCVLSAQMLAGAALVELGEFSRAVPYLEFALSRFRDTLPANNPTLAECSMWWALSQRVGPDKLSQAAVETLVEAAHTLSTTLGEDANMTQRARRALKEFRADA